MVSEVDQSDSGSAIRLSSPSGPSGSPIRDLPSLPPPRMLTSRRKRGRVTGFSERAAIVAASVLKASTRQVYDSRLFTYQSWCGELGFPPDSAPLGVIADLLLHLFDKGSKPELSQVFRSAISSIHYGFVVGSSFYIQISF